ncbi:hypothetical protein NX059_005702 [Plenodomus lindquistii]|nr:hypothetical protein NX059_005702 [Plenodomus lindquistii]
MSAPSSDGRPSVDSEPSYASSRTLLSRGSGTHAEVGEGGSSSPRHSRGSRPGTSVTYGASGSDSGGSPLSRDSIQERDFARRKERVRTSGGFLLDSGFGSSPLSRQMQVDGHTGARGGFSTALPAHNDRGYERLRTEKTRESAQALHHTVRGREPSPNPAAQAQPIDPNQLVHMALNLSESRRRNVSAGQLLAPQPRNASGAQREGSLSGYGAGSSLRQYLNEQRRASRNISPMGGGKGSPSRNMSMSAQRSGSMAFAASQLKDPSPATLARVDKARAYIELKMEYLRLLDYLPPLKPDANNPENFTFTSNSVPGSPHAQLTRVPSRAGKQFQLGREYNPLQYIRNRRSRARERRCLDHPSAEFADVDEVRDWVDRVEQHSQRFGYRGEDAVQLPKLHEDHPVAPAPVQPARPHKGWVFTPEELLADAHWLEQGDNKMLAENRHGRRIFPPKEPKQHDLLQPRASKELPDKRRRSWADDVAGGHGTGDESDKGSERGRKRKLLTVLRTDSPRGGKHSRRGSRLRNKDDSDSSGSESDSGRRTSRLPGETDHNIGPLALLLEQQTKQAQLKTPQITSPDTPDKWGRDDVEMSNSSNNTPRQSLEVPGAGNGSANVKEYGSYKAPPKVRKIPTLSIDDTEPRSSLEDWDSTAPNTPLHPTRSTHFGTDTSPPPSRAGSEHKRTKRSKLNIFHSHEHSDSQKHEIRPDTADTDKNGRSRQTSEETYEDKHIGTSILAAPSAVRNLLTHRKNDSVSSLPSPDKLRRRETVEPQSAVTRFFKGAKHGGSKVGEFIFRRDRADDSDAETVSDRDSLDLDTDASVKAKRNKQPPVSRVVTAGTINSVASDNNDRNHLDLPSFRPVNGRHRDDVGSDGEHHISRQARERIHNRSSRIDKLQPPRMDLGTISGNTSDTSLTRIQSRGQERMKQLLAQPGGKLIGLPATGLATFQQTIDNRQRSSSRPTLDGKRHWSIADDNDENVLHRKKSNPNTVSVADIARVRALFLCSGIKAKEIAYRARSKRSPPEFLRLAAETAKVELFPVQAKEEHVLAARLLVKELEVSTRSLQSSLESFRDKAIKDLTSKITELHSTVDTDLIPRILDSSDHALRITGEIAAQGPLQVKQVTDEIDRMLRVRRRQLSWVWGFGWMMVEWGLVGIMWCLWLVVVLVGSVKRVFGFAIGAVKWLLWL